MKLSPPLCSFDWCCAWNWVLSCVLQQLGLLHQVFLFKMVKVNKKLH